MKRIVCLAALAIWLGACSPDQPKDLAACRVQTDRFYQAANMANPEDPGSQYLIACMAAKGYDFNYMAADCDSRHPLPTQPTCYTPHGWLGWSIDRMRRTLKQN